MKNYRKLTTIAITTIFIITMLSLNLQPTKAAIIERDTFVFAWVVPNPIGVNQNLQITFQMDKTSPTAIGLTGGDHFTGFTVEVTKPDGTTETLGPAEAWAMSGAFFNYVPTQVGTYTFQTFFPGQWINTTFTDYYFRPSESTVTTLDVQEDPIPGWPDVPLPTEYWERPIYAENKGWNQVADNWLFKGYDIATRPFPGSPAFAPYTSAPNSGHILWNRELWYAGIVGGPFGDKTYYTGLAYEQPFEPIIIHGDIIYVEHGPASNNPYGTRSIDMYTGEENWFLPGVTIDFAQTLNVENPNEHGIVPHLWDQSGFSSNRTLVAYDPITGIKQFTITNASYGQGQSLYWGPIIAGPSGELIGYSLNANADYLQMWNSSKAIYSTYRWIGDGPEGGGIYNPPIGGIIDGRLGIQWRVNIPDFPSNPNVWKINVQEGADKLIAIDQDSSVYPYRYIHVAYPLDLQKDSSGNYPDSIQPLWSHVRTNIMGQWVRISRNINDGVYAQFDEATATFHVYDEETGIERGTAGPFPEGFGIFNRNYIIAYGKIFTVGYGGHVLAYDVETLELVWDSYYGSSGFETPYGSWPTYAGPTVADGKLFTTNDDHSPDSVLWRGGKMWVFDTDTGAGLWNISGWYRIPAISDGVLVAANSLDGKIYAFGKGPSATTVVAPQNAIQVGESFTITGAVTDQSPGTKDTPAIADEDMSAWMEYMYMQKPFPSDAKGVDVTLATLDPNGNLVQIGQTTTDLDGNFGFTWTPQVPGTHQIIATFAGSNSYGSSYGTSYLSAVEAPQPTPPPEPTPAPMTDTYIAGSTIAIVAAIVVVALLLLRKK
jgi:hypothetical protein